MNTPGILREILKLCTQMLNVFLDFDKKKKSLRHAQNTAVVSDHSNFLKPKPRYRDFDSNNLEYIHKLQILV